MGESKLTPLQFNVEIVNPDGTPTPYFIQLLQQLYEEKQLTDDAVANNIIAGAGLTGGGSLSAGPVTLAASVQAILNLITTTRGAILYRGASVWSALLPGAAGLFLQTQGAGADPVWAAAGGGGGGSTPTIRSFNQGSSSWSSINIPWPAGTVAGDVVVVFAENGFAGVTFPATWTFLNGNQANWTNYSCAAKVMTAADITAGSVNVTASGNFNGYWCAVCLTGTTVTSLGLNTGTASPGSASQATWPIVGLAGAVATDQVIGFGAVRGTMTPTFSAGITLLTPALNAANASGGVFRIPAAGIGKLGINELMTLPAGNNGACMALVSFK